MIRFANKDDLNNIQIIEDLTFKDGHYSFEQINYEYKENPFAKILVDIDYNTLKGFLIYMVTFNSATIVQIATHPKYQRQKIATSLLKALEQELLKTGYGVIETITLEVRDKNKIAHALYLNNGYKDIHIKKKYYDNGDDAFYMAKRLL